MFLILEGKTLIIKKLEKTGNVCSNGFDQCNHISKCDYFLNSLLADKME